MATTRQVVKRTALAAGLAGLAVGGWIAYRVCICANFGVVAPGKVYRSAQPSPRHLRAWTRAYGLKTVINLRRKPGKEDPAGEVAAAEELGLRYVEIRFSSRRLPSVRDLRRLAEALENSPVPMLIHCRGGADRTGLASVMAAMALGGEPYDRARAHMSLWYLHLDDDPDRIAGLLEEYESYCRGRGAATGGWQEFKTWALEVYHPAYYFVEIAVPETVTAKPDERLCVDVTITNRSQRTIPAGAEGRNFALGTFSSTCAKGYPNGGHDPDVALPRRDIAPGGSVTVSKVIIAPSRPGRYTVWFDVVEVFVTWFALRGSPVAACELVVVE